jgi:hypothetical protein
VRTESPRPISRLTLRRGESRSRSRIPTNRIPGVWPASDQKASRKTAPRLSQAVEPTAITRPPPPSPLPPKALATRVTRATRAVKARLTKTPSMTIARPRLTTPARSVGTSRCLRKKTRRTTRSTRSSRRRARLPIVRPMSSSRPTPWALIAARTSGASAIRSTSCCASSLASSRRQTSSTSSLSIASSSAFLTASLSSAPSTASSTTGPSSTRAIARSTALLSTAATIASSAATSTARSIPVALVTVRAPRTPAPSRRAESGSEPFWVGSPASSIRGTEPFSIPWRVYAWVSRFPACPADGRGARPARAGPSPGPPPGRTTRPGPPPGTPPPCRCAGAIPS